MKNWALLIVGMVTPHLFSTVVPLAGGILLLIVALFLLALPRWRISALLLLGFLFTSHAIQQRLAQRLQAKQENSVQVVRGTIGSLPDYRDERVRFDFLPDAGQTPLPPKIRVYWYTPRYPSRAANPLAGRERSLPQLHAGERWQMQLKLRTTKGRVNFHGTDYERRLFADGVGALATVKDGHNLRLAGPPPFNLQHWREVLLAKLRLAGGELPAFRLLAALAIADQRGLLRSDRRVLSATGTGHLLAISGLHIGLAAAMGFYLGRLGLLLFPTGLRQRLAVGLPWLICWLAALVYAAMAGFGVSTQRALIMLSVATLVLVGKRNVHPLLAWMIALAGVLIADPFAPLRAGFWFSFTAVAVLLFLFTPRYGVMPVWRRILFAQLGISLVMAPLGMYWFQQASLPGLLANLVAIPVVSLVVVPLLIFAMLLLGLPGPVAGWCLTGAAYVTQGLMLFLTALASLQPGAMAATRAPGLLSVILAMSGALALLMPRGIPGRLGGALLLLPLLVPAASRLAPDEVRVDLLDVGQGLSVLVSSNDYLLVYDTGPGNGLTGEAGWDTVTGVIQPLITATGRQPDRVVASNGDMDHAGGLAHLRQLYPHAHYQASLRKQRTGIEPCIAPAAWSSASMNFNILHPSVGLPYLGNDSSCVISMRAGKLSLLLSGDISRVVEHRLVSAGLQPHRLLTVPHHGSLTSSSTLFIEQVNPALALISSGPSNRFGFPRNEVLARFAARGISTLNSGDCGGIRVIGDTAGHTAVKTARNSRAAIWRWPGAPGCP